jgi:hypothetical protein
MACRGPLLGVAAACTLLLLLPALAAAQAGSPAAQSSPDEFLNIRGLPLMMPINRTTGQRRWYYEIPREPSECADGCWVLWGASRPGRCQNAPRAASPQSRQLAHVSSTGPLHPLTRPLLPPHAVGVLVMLHRCGRNAEDFWPPSSVCPQCIGMPEAVSISRQALARGYALLAINSANRTVGSRGRCWRWAAEAACECVVGLLGKGAGVRVGCGSGDMILFGCLGGSHKQQEPRTGQSGGSC